MLNLLPSKQKKELRLDLLSQIIISVAVAVIFIILVLAPLLLIAQGFLNMSLEELERELSLWQSKAEIKELKDLEKKVRGLNKNLVFLDKAYKNQIKFSSILENLVQDAPLEVRFDSISIQEKKVSVRGYALTRDILLSFKGVLENASYVSDFDFPLSNLTKAADIDFSLSFTYEY